jgi:2-amino-4-hydroxy-6-hydroxymethyldihydropteridine diphosphokinase
MPTIAYIAVGANIEPERNILAALEMLDAAAPVCAVSTFYRTAPIGRPEQPEYLNGVVAVLHDGSARELKYGILRPIEAALGRVRTADKFAARTIDLDVILHGDTVCDEPELRLPDPDLRTRAFIAAPLLEIAPELRLPGSGERLTAPVLTEPADLAFSAEVKKRFAR